MVQVSKSPRRWANHMYWILPLILSILLKSKEVVAVSEATRKKTAKYHRLCVSAGKASIKPTDRRRHLALQKLLEVTPARSLETTGSAQHMAACWMLFDDPKLLRPSASNFMQRYALVVLWFGMAGRGWEIKDGWLSKKDECSWYGVECGRSMLGSKRVTGLDLGFNNLVGELPPELALLTYMEEVDLHGNEVQGVVPNNIFASWKHLKALKLHMNGLFGQLPTEVGLLSSLRELSVFGNYFQGSIPRELGNLKNLEMLDIYANNFEGTIPASLGNLKSLKEMDVHDNDLEGRMPASVCSLKATSLTSDCLGRVPEVRCDCCTICCQGLPDLKCVDVATRKEIRYDFSSYATEMHDRKVRAKMK